jgi:acetyltransferase-like isoleucine patch superfamily enzyme
MYNRAVPHPEVHCDRFVVGDDVTFGAGVKIAAADGGRAKSVVIGDNVTIGDGVRILAPDVAIGDYTVVHAGALIYGYKPCAIGACAWVGQGAILNCTDELSIGNGCTISALANLWTHFKGGDTLQGCRYFVEKPLTLEADVWLGVGVSVAPVRCGERSVVFANSVVTRDLEPNHVYGGNPAVDLTEKLGPPYLPKSIDEKMMIMEEKLAEFLKRTPEARRGRIVLIADPEVAEMKENVLEAGVSFFNAANRLYTKKRTAEEIAFMRFLLPVVKFYPMPFSPLAQIHIPGVF